MRHPVTRDRFRYFVVQQSVFSLLLVYIVMAIGVSALIALGLAIANTGPSGLAFSAGFVAVLKETLGQNADLDWSGVRFGNFVSIATAVYFVSVSTLLLGAIVYKVTTPRKNLMIFRDHVNIDPESGTLETSFYSSTHLQVHEMRVTGFFKYYRPRNADDSENLFPMVTINIGNEPLRHLPVPYEFIPVRVETRVQIVERIEDADFENERVAFVIEDGGYRIWMDGQEVSRETDRLCELYVLVEGKLPQAPNDLLEVHRFDLFKDVRLGRCESFEPRYNHDTKEYKVTRWDRF